MQLPLVEESEREVSAAAAAKVVQPRSAASALIIGGMAMCGCVLGARSIFAITFSMAFLIKSAMSRLCLCMLSNVLFQVPAHGMSCDLANRIGFELSKVFTKRKSGEGATKETVL
eukprot:4894889-Amphidinium_carterae.1